MTEPSSGLVLNPFTFSLKLLSIFFSTFLTSKDDIHVYDIRRDQQLAILGLQRDGGGVGREEGLS